jgi:HKD family nuclease
MKVFMTAALHGKTYIFHAPRGNAFAEPRAYVGSSNLTNEGFYQNLELNIDVVDRDASGKLAQ